MFLTDDLGLEIELVGPCPGFVEVDSIEPMAYPKGYAAPESSLPFTPVVGYFCRYPDCDGIDSNSWGYFETRADVRDAFGV